MAIIVRIKDTHKKYILLGTGFGAYKAVRPSLFGGDLIPHEEEGTIRSVAVCDSKGDIIWIDSNNLQVIEVDGVKISEIELFEVERKEEELNRIHEEELNSEVFCPACGTKINGNETCCPGCGITFID